MPGDINVDDLQDITDLFEFKEIAKKSKAKQIDVDTLVKQLKKDAGTKQKIKLVNANSGCLLKIIFLLIFTQS